VAANTAPIFPLSPVVGIATLTSATAVTSLANITGTTGLTQLTPTSTNGKRIDAITVKGKGTTVASKLDIWIYNGTTSFIFDEFDVTATTASNTADAFILTKTYSNLVLPATYQLFVSETVQTDLNVFAFGGDY
jgi:hypothetical protein